ncbi:hypothetical protein [Virgibacillus halodenitrificans]|uniref:hypothetical protein n=1 Tax=Virgibacillus halodenitrificans TaxID=1482 RepID=UPI000EF48D9B|nr:hypothetical protein [Virgibacillus halodenitrificans]
MKIENEYESYIQYVSNFYPKSSMVSSSNVHKYKNIIHYSFKTIYLLDLYYHYQGTSIKSKSLLMELKMSFVRFLYVLPINDYFFIETILRAISENVLRVVYNIIYPDKGIEEIKKLSYRNLWQNGIKKSNVFSENNTTLSNINNIYRQKSDTIHSSRYNYENQIDYMIDLMIEDSQMSLKQLESDIMHLYQFILHEMKIFLDVNEQDLTLQQINVLKMVT